MGGCLSSSFACSVPSMGLCRFCDSPRALPRKSEVSLELGFHTNLGQDEFFHIPQAQKYCEGRFREWDDKITTPPGL